ncbi:MAG: protease, partial [Bacteroidales bacterium]|nr:protease [Bacteroidales bacterium]
MRIKYMKFKIMAVAAACALAFSCAKEEVPAETGPAVRPAGDFRPGELLIKFAPEMSGILDKLGSVPATRSGIPSTDEVLEMLGACRISRVFPVDSRTEARTREAGLHLWYLVEVPEETDLDEACERLSKLGEVSKAQCNRLIYKNHRKAGAF